MYVTISGLDFSQPVFTTVIFAALLILLVAAVIVYFITKDLVKVILTVLSEFTIGSIILSVSLAQSIDVFESKVNSSTKLIILYHNNTPIFGFRTVQFTNADTEWLLEDQLKEYYRNATNSGYRAILKETSSEVLVLADTSVLRSSSSVLFQGRTVSSKLIVDAIESEDPVAVLFDFFLLEANVAEQSKPEIRRQLIMSIGNDPDKIRVFALSLVIKGVLDNTTALITNYRNGKIRIYPDSFRLQIMRYSPKLLFNAASLGGQ